MQVRGTRTATYGVEAKRISVASFVIQGESQLGPA